MFRTLIRIAIFDQFFSFGDESANVVELQLIDWVRENLIPRSACEASVWLGLVIKDMNCVRIVMLESEIVSHVHLLLKKFIGLGKLNGSEEVREIFVNSDRFMRHREAPFLKVVLEDFLDDKQDSCTDGHEEEWECRTDLFSIKNVVLGKHGVSLLMNKAPCVFEDLLIAQHPVAVVQQ